jgi:small subunit ribosomal protein S2
LVTPVTMKALLEAGVHFGHQTRRWDPRMRPFIFTERNGIHILDLQQTVALLAVATEFVRDLVAGGQNILFVGTKKQARDSIQGEAIRCSMPYVTNRWLGGTLTNFATIQKRIDHLVRLEDGRSRGEYDRLPKKEILRIDREIERLNRHFGGIKEMTQLPGALFIVDPTMEYIAAAEARRMGIPIVAMCDTNCNPDEMDYPIPSNDDAIRAIKLMTNCIAESVLEGLALREYVAEGVVPGEMAAEIAAKGIFSVSPDEPAPAQQEEPAPQEEGLVPPAAPSPESELRAE